MGASSHPIAHSTRRRSAILALCAGSTLDMSINKLALEPAEAIPWSPNTTASTAAPSVRQVRTKSAS